MWKDYFLYTENNPLIFTQTQFWIFFAVVMIVFQFVYKKLAARNVFLLLFSLFFYYKSSGFFFLLLLLSTFIDFHFGNWLYAEKRVWMRKFYIVLSLVINLGILGYFKYTNFFAGLINQIWHTNLQPVNWLSVMANNWWGTNYDITDIFLPVGISFYTFQSISYCIDIYRGEIKPVKSLLDYAFFVSFFPQLVAGPIVRASEFVPQLYKPYNLELADFGRAIFLIINGLIKKILISDYISANYVDRVFETPLTYTGFENLMAVYGYAIQIYCDFSGYTDIAIGLALLMGFRLNINFNSPYKADSITDFWRRWHISLSTWLRDYLYIPLGGNRKGKVRTYINLFLTMLLGGLWHGAHVRFVIWGALHGLGLTLHKFYMSIFKTKKRDSGWGIKFLGQVFTFHFVAFCWIFFRADSMQVVNDMLVQIGNNFQPDLIMPMIESYRTVFGIMLLGYLIHWLPQRWKDSLSQIFIAVPVPVKAVVIVLVILTLYQVKTAAIQPFIYFQF